MSELERRPAPAARGSGLARLSVVLLVSTVGLAALWHLVYGAGLIDAAVVVVESGVLLALAFATAWRAAR